MKFITLILWASFFVYTLLCCVQIHAVTVVIPTSKDAQVTFFSRVCPGNCPNEGGSPIIVIGTIEISSEGLFGFDLSSIPAGANITSAILQLPRGTSPLGTQEITFDVFKLIDNESWDEFTVVASNAPNFTTPAIGTVTFVQPGPASPLDVTEEAIEEFSKPTRSLGFAVTAQFGNVFFNSRESGLGGATLNVTYTPPDVGVNCGLRTCPRGDSCCNQSNGVSVCYNPLTHTCTTGGLLCPRGFDSCRDQCFSLQNYVCINGFLCPVGTVRCGTSNVCYDPFNYQCFQPGNRLCPSGTLPCGNACYNASQYSCCPNNVLVPLGSSC